MREELKEGEAISRLLTNMVGVTVHEDNLFHVVHKEEVAMDLEEMG